LAAPDASLAQPGDGGPWRTYRSERFGFELRYPELYVLVEEASQSAPAGQPLMQIRLLDRAMAQPPLASVAPAQFAVEVYANPSRDPLEPWVVARGFVPPVDRFGHGPARVGDVDGIRVTDRAQLAPNLYYFVAREAFVYRLVPLGPFADAILASFRFLGG
jgi:hypothetical protein